MTDGSRLLLYLLLAAVIVPVALLFLSTGPLGWLAAGLVAFCALMYQAVRDEPSESSPDRTICPDCGSPNDPDADRCDYCAASL